MNQAFYDTIVNTTITAKQRLVEEQKSKELSQRREIETWIEVELIPKIRLAAKAGENFIKIKPPMIEEVVYYLSTHTPFTAHARTYENVRGYTEYDGLIEVWWRDAIKS